MFRPNTGSLHVRILTEDYYKAYIGLQVTVSINQSVVQAHTLYDSDTRFDILLAVGPMFVEMIRSRA